MVMIVIQSTQPFKCQHDPSRVRGLRTRKTRAPSTKIAWNVRRMNQSPDAKKTQSYICDGMRDQYPAIFLESSSRT